ncbi:MAG: OsmC family peroxiredoxin [Chitinivibrionales bacterium]|nr:OsmC family peroxiredoxin [Chitinivibrionales bacterium]MBD3358697.1 OsmC family peroxiredoxin [Chitinivibrionales bacterium]
MVSAQALNGGDELPLQIPLFGRFISLARGLPLTSPNIIGADSFFVPRKPITLRRYIMAGKSAPIAEKARVSELRNGVDTHALVDTIEAIKADPKKASCTFFATTSWKKGTVSDTKITHYDLGGEVIPQDFTMTVDEPMELLGADTAPNPQMLLFTALNTCVLNTFIVNASAKGIRVESVEIETRGELDLRGFLAIDKMVNPGYNELNFVFRIKGDGTQEQFRECLEAGTRYSPNFQTITRAVKVNYDLEIK